MRHRESEKLQAANAQLQRAKVAASKQHHAQLLTQEQLRKQLADEQKRRTSERAEARAAMDSLQLAIDMAERQYDEIAAGLNQSKSSAEASVRRLESERIEAEREMRMRIEEKTRAAEASERARSRLETERQAHLAALAALEAEKRRLLSAAAEQERAAEVERTNHRSALADLQSDHTAHIDELEKQHGSEMEALHEEVFQAKQRFADLEHRASLSQKQIEGKFKESLARADQDLKHSKATFEQEKTRLEEEVRALKTSLAASNSRRETVEGELVSQVLDYESASTDLANLRRQLEVAEENMMAAKIQLETRKGRWQKRIHNFHPRARRQSASVMSLEK